MIKFIKTKTDKDGNKYYSLLEHDVAIRKNILVNTSYGVDQRAISLIQNFRSLNDVEGEIEDFTSLKNNYNYLLTLYGAEGNLEKDYPNSYREVKNIFK
jgi:hypothetical protein